MTNNVARSIWLRTLATVKSTVPFEACKCKKAISGFMTGSNRLDLAHVILANDLS